MWYKASYEFIYKPKDFLSSDKSFEAALREFFSSKGYFMEQAECEEDDYKVFTIEPMPEIIDKKEVVKIPKK